ncbi:hypothetical protein MACJ_000693 [Theileria orientalis]|uniref:Uncharacterized protein n=1 Tax=Theileria orientalis TaxID=68886 RepID=A0A976M4G4_THEOR|nr:hypothetical protein MACJ_000693 [Theileria orientalis]
MSLNLELHEKAIKFAERICGPNCERCKLALQENLEIRARLYCASLKRPREEPDDSEIYYDAIEFDPDFLPANFFKNSYKKFFNSTPSEVNNSYVQKSDSAKEPLTSNDPEPPAKRKKKNTLGLTRKEAQDLLDGILRRTARQQRRRQKMNYAKDPNKVKPVKYELPDYIRNQDWSTLNSVHYLESIKYLKRPGDDKQVAPEPVTTVPTDTSAEGLSNLQTNIESPTDVGPSSTLEEGVVQDTVQQPEFQLSFQDHPKDHEVKEPSAIFGSLDAISDLLQKPKEPETVEAKPRELPKVDVTPKEPQRIDTSSSEPEPKKRFNLFETTSTEKEATLSEPKKDKPFDIFHKVNLPIPQGNPLFAPKQDDSSISQPKTEGSNFIFGQSSTDAQSTSVAPPAIVFGSTQPTQLSQPREQARTRKGTRAVK